MLDGSQQDWARNQSVRAAASARADLTRSDTADELEVDMLGTMTATGAYSDS